MLYSSYHRLLHCIPLHKSRDIYREDLDFNFKTKEG